MTNTNNDALDAARWRALFAGDRMRAMGSAGFNHDGTAKPDRDLHMGIEFWTDHPNANQKAIAHCRTMLESYVERIGGPKADPVIDMDTVGQDEQACNEGWSLIECGDGQFVVVADLDSDNATFRQGGDPNSLEPDNLAAYEFVRQRAAEGSAYHKAALAKAEPTITLPLHVARSIQSDLASFLEDAASGIAQGYYDQDGQPAVDKTRSELAILDEAIAAAERTPDAA